MLSFFETLRDWWLTRRTRQITPEKARERVQRGAAFLDNADPEWYRRVDPETLALSDGHHCVLGQIHGEFRLGLGRSHLISLSSAPRASLSPVAYGFKCVDGVSDDWQKRDYDLLDEAWKEAVQNRQADDPTMEPGRSGASGDSLPEESVEMTPTSAAT